LGLRLLLQDSSPSPSHASHTSCQSCGICETTCPTHAIELATEYEREPSRQQQPTAFSFKEWQCIRCGLCQLRCPYQALAFDAPGDASTRYSQTSGSPEAISLAELATRTPRPGVTPLSPANTNRSQSS
jgi:formate hydrogenlyase subunit 6/NADH:ubiquinone oxidoreductase subunit I